PKEVVVEALDDGDAIATKEIALRITARYRAFGLYETALLGMLAQSTGWATAARECVDVATPDPVVSFGARHVHPDITDVLDYAAIVGGCVGASTPAGARLAGLNPTGTMPHSLVLIFGDTVRAAEAFDRDIPADVPRIVLVDTFKDEAEEALRVAHALGDRLYGIRLDTPSERGRVTAELVHEVRERLDQADFHHVRITVSGGLTPERIGYFKEAGAPVDSYAVGSYISGATPIDFTGDIKEIDGEPIAKRGRIPGLTDSPRLKPVDLAPYREA
ncbi:MAG: nicotinate phosphoribosyltransferase, partial [Chloroflexota bacterium]